ncbi:hypothetical protein [Anaeroselena agilis]|uniref:Tail tubular protein A n=1 Tax=Anaeroselena agilis TaxID=3063788 RepID=A0ABU3NWU1_9FIRM|nr:hypothetical protein [Selenomonadales bacterium 4137-cl]
MLISSNVTVDAINEILSAIGDAPVNSIENPTNVNVINAIAILERTNRKEQARGWSFNIRESYTLNPDTTTKKIPWSNLFLRIKSADGTKYVRRGDYLYNFTDQTYTFERAIEVECILLVSFEEMPEAMRSYITAKAALEFQVKYQGDEALTEELKRNLADAWARLQEDEMDLNNFNVLDTAEVALIARRH